MVKLTVEEIRDVESFQELREEWDNLLEKSGDNNVFLTWEWLFLWWRYHRSDKQLRILLIKDQDNIVGIAPFMEWRYQKGFFHINIMENICAEECDYSGVILTDHIEESLSTLLDYLQGIIRDGKTLVRIWHVPGQSDFLTTLNEIYQSYINKLSLHSRISGICPYIDLPATWDEFFQTLGGNTRKTYRRQINRLERDYTVEFNKYCGENDLNDKLENLFNFHKKRWEQREINSKFMEMESRGFYFDVSKAFYEKGWLDLSFINIDDKTVSIEWGFNYNGGYWNMTRSFDPDFSRYGVGSIHAMYLIQDAINKNQNKFDLLKGTESYKNHYTKNQTLNYVITINSKSFTGICRVIILDLFAKFARFNNRSFRENITLLAKKIRSGKNSE